jgi:ribosome biogenesis protein ERB1
MVPELIDQNPNTIGNVPIEWYDDLPHIGYDVNGRKIFRPAKGDELDKFLSNVEDPAAWTSVEDKLLQQQVQLSDKELDIIRRLERAENPDADYDPYEPTIEWFTGKGLERTTPLSAAPEPKSRFVPSKWEHKKVSIYSNTRSHARSRTNHSDHEDCQGYPRRPNSTQQAFCNETIRLCDLVRCR